MSTGRYVAPDTPTCDAFQGGDGETEYTDVCVHCHHHKSEHEVEGRTS